MGLDPQQYKYDMDYGVQISLPETTNDNMEAVGLLI